MNHLTKKKILHHWNKLKGVSVEWDLSSYRKILTKISEIDLSKASDKELKKRSERLIEKARQGTFLDKLLGEAYALVRETAWRTVGMRPFDVQVFAGIVMHQGKLAEMNTGEGKTLVAVLPAYLNAISGKGVHIHTFNDYLARRDAAWMGPIYKFLGLKVGCIQEGMSPSERKKAYNADITYSTAKEAGFDFLRDQLCFEKKDLVHREFHYVIVDEADSILIDEARVPLVIAGSTDRPKADPGHLVQIAKGLKEDVDFETDEGKRNIYLTPAGLQRVETILDCNNLHAPENIDLLTRLNQALHAEYLLHRDIDYIVRKGKIEIVDEFTGRVVEDQHWPDGLQAAVEAKEKLRLGSGGSILGSITLQHFLELYPKISGMTATAQPAADELKQFYGLTVVVVPPNRPCIRKDFSDEIYTHKKAKTDALIDEIKRCHETERPVLVGTASVEESEELAADLEKSGVSCHVLNAKNDELEAQIIAQAGSPGAVTISTNMAGRGTDIRLGGDKEQERDKIVGLGGLYVIGTNRHESLRIDQQLRGRAGRQGDPGSSRFFISLEDNLIERYNMRNLLPKKYRALKQAKPIGNPLVQKEIARGQRIIEGQNFEIRKTLWKYSILVERQRDMTQRRRQEILCDGSNLGFLEDAAPKLYSRLESLMGESRIHEIEQQITLYAIDQSWTEHLAMIADIREGIHLTSVGGQSPIREFHKIVDQEFQQLEQKIDNTILQTFKSLPVTEKGIDLDEEGIRGPSSTWTYVITDNQFGLWVGMLQGSNIGATAVAAAAFGPLYILLGLVQRFYKKEKK
ncbi:MAG: accessory Sec system translocase SecA2 [Candidatus Aminicenantes bacterium]|nr:MAG: accessory Sec system translocase SecA2 [Candidatus Aminicenantes bacterium]